MGIMDVIRKMAQNKSEKNQRFKEMQEQDRLETMLQERKKSSNRRELEKYYEEREEKRIKEQLDIIRKKQNSEAWTGNSILKSDFDILKSSSSGGCSILKDNKKLFSSKAKGRGCMFFK